MKNLLAEIIDDLGKLYQDLDQICSDLLVIEEIRKLYIKYLDKGKEK